jgi:hypothetical protein
MPVRRATGAPPLQLLFSRAALRQQGPLDPATQRARLVFSDSDRRGTFQWGDRSYPVTVLNLPSVVESYKTLDDVNLVKTCDIGQVGPLPRAPCCSASSWACAARPCAPSFRLGPPAARAPPQVLVVGDEPGLAEEAASGEARDGVTPPMRNARERIFRKPIEVPPDVVQKVEYDLLTILAVRRAGAAGCRGCRAAAGCSCCRQAGGLRRPSALGLWAARLLHGSPDAAASLTGPCLATRINQQLSRLMLPLAARVVPRRASSLWTRRRSGWWTRPRAGGRGCRSDDDPALSPLAHERLMPLFP